MHCGVPQCNNYYNKTVSMHQIPGEILNSPKELTKWAAILRMGKKFPKYFLICSEHFEKHHILKSIVSGKTRLAKGAIPTRNLPVSSVITTRKADGARERRLKSRSANYIDTEQ